MPFTVKIAQVCIWFYEVQIWWSDSSIVNEFSVVCIQLSYHLFRWFPYPFWLLSVTIDYMTYFFVQTSNGRFCFTCISRCRIPGFSLTTTIQSTKVNCFTPCHALKGGKSEGNKQTDSDKCCRLWWKLKKKQDAPNLELYQAFPWANPDVNLIAKIHEKYGVHNWLVSTRPKVLPIFGSQHLVFGPVSKMCSTYETWLCTYNAS